MNIFYIILLIPIVFIFIFLLIFVFSFLLNLKKFSKKYKKIKSELREYKDDSIFKKIFVSLPRSLAYDYFNKDPNIFNVYGLNLITGMQGSGKTITLCYLIRKYKQIYPRLCVKTNFDCKIRDGVLHNYHDLENNANGIYGEMDCISELQTWFDNQQSKNFPPSLLSVVTQQRHVRRAIFGDTQIFNRICKQLREQCYRIYEPNTILGCFTIVNVYEPILDENAVLISKNHIDTFCFVHDYELRHMYDSYSNITGLNV